MIHKENNLKRSNEAILNNLKRIKRVIPSLGFCALNVATIIETIS